MEQLAADSSILEFTTGTTIGDMPPESYTLRFLGRGLWKEPASGRVLVREEHEVAVQLGASYPRTIPEMTWRTAFYHPNVSGSGIVCLGGYSTHWVPSLGLESLCEMLWDMIRYHNFDTESPYNREAAHWVKTQRDYPFPLDRRPIRDRVAKVAPRSLRPPVVSAPTAPTAQEVVFIEPSASSNSEHVVNAQIMDHDDDIIEAELVDGPGEDANGSSGSGGSNTSATNAAGRVPEDPDILFID
jgi:hypothetical protein